MVKPDFYNSDKKQVTISIQSIVFIAAKEAL